MNARTKSCEVVGLAAGTTVAFRALSYKDGAWSTPSEVAVARTEDSPASAACANQLNNEAKSIGGLNAGGAVLVVLGIVAALFLIGGIIFMMKRRAPPPPPPGMKGVPPPPGY